MIKPPGPDSGLWPPWTTDPVGQYTSDGAWAQGALLLGFDFDKSVEFSLAVPNSSGILGGLQLALVSPVIQCSDS